MTSIILRRPARRKAATSEQVKRVRALRHRGLSIMTIAAETSLSRSAIGRITVDMMADARAMANRKRAAEIAPPWLYQALLMLADGLTQLEISRRLGIPKSTVYRHLSAAGS